MKTKIKILILIIFTSVFFASFFVTVIYFINFFITNRQLDSTFSVAFTGAFFAFLFTQVGIWFGQFSKRKNEGYNSLVSFQFFLNQQLGAIQGNIFTIKDINKTLEKVVSENALVINPNSFKYCSPDYDILNNFKSLDFMNDVMKYYNNYEKTEDSLRVSSKFYQMVVGKTFGKRSKEEVELYVANAKVILDTNRDILRFLKSLSNENIKLFAKLNVLLKDKPLIITFAHMIKKTKYTKKFLEKAEVEESKIRIQLEKSTRENTKIIFDTLNKND